MKMQFSSKSGDTTEVRSSFQKIVHQSLNYRSLPQNQNRGITDAEKEIIKQEQSGKIKWGAPTWYLFHTMAEKVREESFPLIRKELLNIIYTICTNLPCPDCSNHATKYMNGVNFDAILTKQDLKDMLFRFHNSVNARKNFPIFSKSELDEKYAAANTTLIVQYFFQVYEKSTASSKINVNFLYRTRSINNTRAWFSANIFHFNI
jgi:hypothetical protein